ncbi:unnamed protein product [Stenotrophomonas maltophilia]|nr:unnamed protein product [Stenotrophomonas maltophilia]
MKIVATRGDERKQMGVLAIFEAQCGNILSLNYSLKSSAGGDMGLPALGVWSK